MERNVMKYYIETWGCQMNEEDSEKISGILKINNYQRTDDEKDADIIIFNTCCVRENAEQKVHGHLGYLKAQKKNNPDLIIAVTGCMTQQKGTAEKLLKKFPHVDIITGSFNSYKLPEYIERVKQSGNTIVEVWDKENKIVEGLPIDRKSDVKAFVTIMYGCNNFCSYCIVPYVRGRERSRTPEDILKEVKDLVSRGYKEITLLGQNVNSYGIGLTPSINFSGLLKKVNEVEGLERIRFMTSHPKDIHEELIQTMLECDKVCEHIHMALQSGSNRMLEKMNRKYTKEHYLGFANKAKEAIPDIAITTDIIVGYPGETEEDFEETLKLAEELQFDSAFTFLYSPREGTPAAKLKDEFIDEKTKHERFNRLLKVINKSVESRNKFYENKTVEVLVEGESKTNDSILMGRTRNFKLVNFEGSKELIGQLVDVKIVRAKPFSLVGEIIDSSIV
ncbi:tRNA (N6-isopentenyl adenosine(37)-C2)-methylthiotransferase MiaB [Clostridium sediminicola]|uniref:tRNA (N6-isopentenyl adenosine(37)-C2)-methylthiotransferase MiaB n=1 Tax=Clostridium sediminicola TaxID=3114879 RepID=UPI0031F212CB